MVSLLVPRAIRIAMAAIVVLSKYPECRHEGRVCNATVREHDVGFAFRYLDVHFTLMSFKQSQTQKTLKYMLAQVHGNVVEEFVPGL